MVNARVLFLAEDGERALPSDGCDNSNNQRRHLAVGEFNIEIEPSSFDNVDDIVATVNDTDKYKNDCNLQKANFNLQDATADEVSKPIVTTEELSCDEIDVKYPDGEGAPEKVRTYYQENCETQSSRCEEIEAGVYAG